MKQKKILRLIEKVVNKTATDEEIERYNLWCESFRKQDPKLENIDEIKFKMLHHIHLRIGHKTSKRNTYAVYITIAASIMLISSILLYIFRIQTTTSVKDSPLYTKEIPATKDNSNSLTLSNGKTIHFSTTYTGNLAVENGMQISKNNKGLITYKVIDPKISNKTKNIYNTLSTTIGQQTQVQLPDGTMVWLNSLSSVTYPISFISKTERRVNLIGEAYFEVSKNKDQPFIVKTHKQEVKVLGTKFNINSYKEESHITTTLLEGSIKVSQNNQSTILKPGQQAVDQQSKLIISEVNTDKTLAWKNGYFEFSDENIESIMRQLARWYDIEVYFDSKTYDDQFNGKISKLKNIEQVLTVLEKTKSIRFKIEGRRITVMK